MSLLAETTFPIQLSKNGKYGKIVFPGCTSRTAISGLLIAPAPQFRLGLGYNRPCSHSAGCDPGLIIARRRGEAHLVELLSLVSA